MSVVSMKQLLEAGVHFGHQTRRWNPKMAPYIFTERNGIYIIDLQKTIKMIDDAYDFMREVGATGKPVLFVGTKKQAQAAIKDEANRCGMYFVNERWLGGMLTNYKTISKRIERLNEIREMEEDGTINKYAKKEILKIRNEAEKLEKFLGGIKDMKGMPGANLMMLLESRLDSVVFRMGFARTRREARQVVDHKHVLVNGKCINIPSYLVKPGDVVEVAPSSRSSVKFSKLTGEDAPVVLLPQWLSREKNSLKGTVTQMPVREDIDLPVEEHLIVELYSK